MILVLIVVYYSFFSSNSNSTSGNSSNNEQDSDEKDQKELFTGKAANHSRSSGNQVKGDFLHSIRLLFSWAVVVIETCLEEIVAFIIRGTISQY